LILNIWNDLLASSGGGAIVIYQCKFGKLALVKKMSHAKDVPAAGTPNKRSNPTRQANIYGEL